MVLGSPLVSNQQDQGRLPILMEFFEKISRSNEPSTNSSTHPMIVHCSAGIGRSGATIAIDIILNRIRMEGLDAEIEIPGLVAHMRSQRSGKKMNFFDANIFSSSISFADRMSQFEIKESFCFLQRSTVYSLALGVIDSTVKSNLVNRPA